MLKAAHAHKGAAFVEIFQNCIVYNDGVFAQFTDRSIAADTQAHLEHGKPVLFGKENDKGIRLNTSTLKLEVVKIGENGVTVDDILVHDEKNKVLATLLAQMQPPALPVALGVIYCEEGPEYVSAVYDQVDAAKAKKKAVPMNELLHSGHTWRVRHLTGRLPNESFITVRFPSPCARERQGRGISGGSCAGRQTPVHLPHPNPSPSRGRT